MKKLIMAAALLLFSGCVKYNEELWFNKDLSGRIKVDVTVEEKIARSIEKTGLDIFTQEGVEELYGGIDGVRVIEMNSTTEGTNRHTAFTLSFDTLESLQHIANAMKDTEFLGFITIEKNPSGSSSFARQMVMRKDARNLITPEQMNSIDWNFMVHFPGKVLEANTPPGRERVKDTRSWVYSLRELANDPQTMKATFAPVSSFDIVALVIAGAVFMFMFFVLYRMLMKKEEE